MKKIFCLLAALAASLTLRGEIVLAMDGRSDYRIVGREGADETERAAVADLAKYLKQITGADFTRAEAKHAIYVGKAAPSDKVPLKADERRIRAENGDLYIYGNGRCGTAFAVYDFLERFLGCRWYTMRGREKIPADRSPRFAEPNYSHIPSFPHPMITGGVFFPIEKQLDDFTRRNRIYARRCDIPQLGPDGHIPGKLIPPGAQFQEQTGHLWRPYRGCEKDAYFADHPEYFSLNRQGKRVPNIQLCYSNPELRKLFDAKLAKIVAEEYKGGAAIMYCDLNDNNGFGCKTICCCPECMKLVEKYRSPAGPYWDYVLELCRKFEEKYPEILLTTTAYLATEAYPEGIGRIPDNLIIRFCPLNKNFLKPYDHPSNRRIVKRFEEWGPRCKNLWIQLYPSIYPRATTTLPLCANLRQLAQNLRVCKAYGVANVNGQQGHIWGNVNAFNELREYMLARMLNDVTLDENVLIEEFIRDNYGKAAPMVLAYWKELEALEAKEKVGLNWYGLSYGAFSYLTGENLARWSRDFDKMETLVADDPAALGLVRDLRFNLDEAILGVNFRMPEGEEFSPTKVAARARRNFLASCGDFTKLMTGKEKQWKSKYMYDFRLVNGLEFFEMLNRKAKPLADESLRGRYVKLIRTLPTRLLNSQTSHLRHLVDDPDAPFGVAVKSSCKAEGSYTLYLTAMRPSGDQYSVNLNDRKSVTVEQLREHVGQYRLYRFGSTRLYPQSMLGLWRICGGSGIAVTGAFFDAKDPLAEYDVYLLLKLDADGVIWVGEVVLGATGRAAAPQKITFIPAAG